MRMLHRRGFSMVELLMTLMIMGIVAMMAVPKLDRRPKSRLKCCH